MGQCFRGVEMSYVAEVIYLNRSDRDRSIDSLISELLQMKEICGGSATVLHYTSDPSICGCRHNESSAKAIERMKEQGRYKEHFQ